MSKRQQREPSSGAAVVEATVQVGDTVSRYFYAGRAEELGGIGSMRSAPARVSAVHDDGSLELESDATDAIAVQPLEPWNAPRAGVWALVSEDAPDGYAAFRRDIDETPGVGAEVLHFERDETAEGGLKTTRRMVVGYHPEFRFGRMQLVTPTLKLAIPTIRSHGRLPSCDGSPRPGTWGYEPLPGAVPAPPDELAESPPTPVAAEPVATLAAEVVHLYFLDEAGRLASSPARIVRASDNLSAILECDEFDVEESPPVGLREALVANHWVYLPDGPAGEWRQFNAASDVIPDVGDVVGLLRYVPRNRQSSLTTREGCMVIPVEVVGHRPAANTLGSAASRQGTGKSAILRVAVPRAQRYYGIAHCKGEPRPGTWGATPIPPA
jgi:hypothetical protein